MHTQESDKKQTYRDNQIHYSPRINRMPVNGNVIWIERTRKGSSGISRVRAWVHWHWSPVRRVSWPQMLSWFDRGILRSRHLCCYTVLLKRICFVLKPFNQCKNKVTLHQAEVGVFTDQFSPSTL